MAKKKRSWSEVKQRLGELAPEDAIALVRDLYGRSDENRSFIEARLSIGNDPLAPFRERIQTGLYPDPIHGPPISVAAARKAISDYRRATGDRRGTLDLMLHYVDCGTSMVLDYGDMDGPFYASLESMFDRAVTEMEKADPPVVEAFLPRAVAIVRRGRGLGWGYYDFLVERLSASFPE